MRLGNARFGVVQVVSIKSPRHPHGTECGRCTHTTLTVETSCKTQSLKMSAELQTSEKKGVWRQLRENPYILGLSAVSVFVLDGLVEHNL